MVTPALQTTSLPSIITLISFILGLNRIVRTAPIQYPDCLSTTLIKGLPDWNLRRFSMKIASRRST
jgi:hypothetical protein